MYILQNHINYVIAGFLAWLSQWCIRPYWICFGNFAYTIQNLFMPEVLYKYYISYFFFLSTVSCDKCAVWVESHIYELDLQLSTISCSRVGRPFTCHPSISLYARTWTEEIIHIILILFFVCWHDDVVWDLVVEMCSCYSLHILSFYKNQQNKQKFTTTQQRSKNH